MFQFLITCEHGGNRVPDPYKSLFDDDKDVLETHKGWDIGILPVAKGFAEKYSFPLYYSETSRLLVELNRSLDAPDLFSKFSLHLPKESKDKILREYYFPYRNKFEDKIQENINIERKVIHISFHSFTPVLDGKVRQTDVGLLFDPQQPLEKAFCERWKTSLIESGSDLQVDHNSPYQGIDDGFTTYLRTKFHSSDYAGIEIEVNQKHLLSESFRIKISQVLNSSFQRIKNQFYN
jgi:predicted N-formylglutamate amidohydrolase